MTPMRWKHTARFCVSAFWMDFANGLLMVALPYTILEMGGDSMSLGSATGVRGIAYGIACLVLSRFSDFFSRRVIINLSLLGLATCFVLLSRVDSLAALYPVLALWAITLAPFWPALFSWLGDSHEPERLGRATSAVNFSWSTGVMLGGVAAGWLFYHSGRYIFLAALLPLAIIWLSLGVYACPHKKPARPERKAGVPGTRRFFAAALLANISAMSLVGLLSGVFPEFGITIGVTPALFGTLMAALSLGRVAVFLAGTRWSARLRDWRLVYAIQVLAAAMVAGISVFRDIRWLWLAFPVAGISSGICYYRGILSVLETPGNRGFKAGFFEAMLFVGMTTGGMLGGVAATRFQLGTPYPMIGAFSLCLLCGQAVLVRWAGKGSGPGPGPGDPPAAAKGPA